MVKNAVIIATEPRNKESELKISIKMEKNPVFPTALWASYTCTCIGI